MCKKNIMILKFLFIFLSIRESVAQQSSEGHCSGSNEVCVEVTKCDNAIKAISRDRFHNFTRCGFDRTTELVCCHDTAGLMESVDVREDHRTGAERACAEIEKSRPVDTELYIVGGEPAEDGLFPNMVALGILREHLLSFVCGGSLVSSTYVLTAAHCYHDRKLVTARIGVLNISKALYNHATDYNISSVLLHPKFKDRKKYHDIALVKLERRVIYSPHAYPACLYTRDETAATSYIAAGWGYVHFGADTSDVLLKVNLTLVPLEKCKEYYSPDRNLNQGLTEEFLCAGDEDGLKDTCQGDSGGPLHVLSPRGDYRVIALTSFGKGCGNLTPAVYTKVYSYIKWIEDIVWPV